MHQTKRAAIGQIMIVALGLALLSGIEFFVGVMPDASTVLLFLLALNKAWLVVYFYMHISRLWSSAEGGH